MFRFDCPQCGNELEGETDEIPDCECGCGVAAIYDAWDAARIDAEASCVDWAYERLRDS